MRGTITKSRQATQQAAEGARAGAARDLEVSSKKVHLGVPAGNATALCNRSPAAGDQITRKKGDKFHSYGISPDQLQSRLPTGTMELREAVVTCQCIIKGEFDLFQSDEGSSDTNTESRFPYRKPVRRVAEDRRLDRNEYGCRRRAHG